MCLFLQGLKFSLIPGKCAGGQGFLAGSRSGRDEAQLTDCLTWIGMCRAWRAKMISSDLLRLWLEREKKGCPDPTATLLIRVRNGNCWTYLDMNVQHALATPNSHIEPISLDGCVAPVKPAMVKRHVKGGNWADFWVARCGQGGLKIQQQTFIVNED